MSSLDRMISSSRRALERRRGARPLAELEEAVGDLEPIRPFTEGVVGEEISFVLRITAADPALVAAAEEAGRPGCPPGDAVPPGLDQHGCRCCTRVLIDPYQLYESRLGGADGVVLIAGAFDGEDERFAEMQVVAMQLGLDVVVEVADEEELELALDLLDPDSFLIQNLRNGGEDPEFEHIFRCSRRCRPGRSCCRRAASATATTCSPSRPPASTRPSGD